MSYAIRKGCQLKVTLPIIELISGRNPRIRAKTSPYKHLGYQSMRIEILKHSYGAKTCQHTFTCKVIRLLKKGTTYEKRSKGEKFLIKGRNLYPYVIEHHQGEESKKDRFISLGAGINTD